MPQDFVTYGQDFQVFDTEEVPVTSGYIGDLLPVLRRKLKDTGSVIIDTFVGDGESVEFRLSGYPIKEGSERLTVSGVALASSGYYLSYPSGLLVLTTSAAAGVPIRIVYLYHEYIDSELVGHIEDAVYEFDRYLATAHTITGGDVSPVLTSEEESLILTMAVRNTYVVAALNSAATSFNWKDEEKSVSKAGVTRNYKDAIDLLEEKIKRLLKEMVRPSSQGQLLAGGTTATKWGGIDWTTSYNV
jgi:hypothetical protein